MANMSISLSDDLKLFVDQQVAKKSFSSTSEYLHELIRRERDAEQLRVLLLEGLNSGPAVPVDEALIAELREIAT